MKGKKNMKILLFGITNVGKTTIGKLLSEKLNYDFDDLDDEIKRRYGKIDNFQSKYPYDYARHRKRGEILKEVIDKYEDNVVIAVSPIYYEEFLVEVLNENNVLAIEIQDEKIDFLKQIISIIDIEKEYKEILIDDIIDEYIEKDYYENREELINRFILKFPEMKEYLLNR